MVECKGPRVPSIGNYVELFYFVYYTCLCKIKFQAINHDYHHVHRGFFSHVNVISDVFPYKIASTLYILPVYAKTKSQAINHGYQKHLRFFSHVNVIIDVFPYKIASNLNNLASLFLKYSVSGFNPWQNIWNTMLGMFILWIPLMPYTCHVTSPIQTLNNHWFFCFVFCGPFY